MAPSRGSCGPCWGTSGGRLGAVGTLSLLSLAAIEDQELPASRSRRIRARTLSESTLGRPKRTPWASSWPCRPLCTARSSVARAGRRWRARGPWPHRPAWRYRRNPAQRATSPASARRDRPPLRGPSSPISQGIVHSPRDPTSRPGRPTRLGATSRPRCSGPCHQPQSGGRPVLGSGCERRSGRRLSAPGRRLPARPRDVA
jgi:hypothetical protein